MSRTIRRKNNRNRHPSEEIIGWTGRVWRIGYYDWEFHSDKYDSNPLTKTLKEFTNERRRSDQRVDIHRLFNDIEYDSYPKEKEYLGYIWNFD